MTIAILADTLFPAVGGQGRMTERLILALAERGHRVVVVTARPPRAARLRPPSGIDVRYAWSVRLLGIRLPFRWAIVTPAELVRLFRREQITLVYSSTLYSPLGLATVRACALLQLPLVAHNHSQPEHLLAVSRLSWATPLRDALYRYLNHVYRHATCVIVSSEREEETVLRRHGFTGAAVVIPNGVDTQFFSPGPPDPQFLSRHALEGKQIVLCVSRLMHDKNLTLLIRAARVLSRERENIAFVLLGDGPERARLVRRVRRIGDEHAVRFPGWISDPRELRAWYRAATAFVLPSTVELQSLAVLEAMATARPVILAHASANLAVGLIADGVSGFLVPADDPAVLVQRLRLLLDDSSLARRIGENGWRTTQASHSLDHVLEKFLGLFQSLTSRV